MDIDTVRTILCDLDLTKYFAASKQTSSADEVWPAHVEDAFLKAVDIFASVGQRKYQVDGKNAKGSVAELVGRNDIISRYIYMKTARYRSRKQVSSHIQVWAHCKKPPSSRNMSMESFDELQTVLRLFYSRPSTAFGQPKKKLRRVASTSSASVADRLAGIGSLGVHSAATSQPSPDGRIGERKHVLDATPENPAKRCRRVVSELPPASLGSLFECGCDDAPLDFADASTAPFWALDCTEQIISTPTASDQSTVLQLALQQPVPMDMCLPLLLQTIDGPAHPSAGMYDLSLAATHGVSAATLSAATMAAMAGFEEALSSPMVHATEYMPMPAAARDSPFDFVALGFMPTLNSSLIQPTCAEMMSAFAAAAAAAANSGYSPCNPASHFGPTMDATGAAVAAATTVATEECNQTLAEAFGRYYANSAMAGTPDLHLPFSTWGEVGAGDGNPGELTVVLGAEPAGDCVLRAQSAIDRGLSMPLVRNSAESESAARTEAADMAMYLGIDAPASKPKEELQAVRPAVPTSEAMEHVGLARAQSMLVAASSPASAYDSQLSLLTKETDNVLMPVQDERLAGGKPSEDAKDLRSSPSCARSMNSISRASDTTLATRGCGDGPAINGAPEGMPNRLLFQLEPDVVQVCGNNSSPVIDWLKSLKSVLDANDIGSHLFADSAYSAEPPFDGSGGHVWPFAFTHNPGGSE
ncbi:hypothetical protein IWW37_004471 [Coemansia sp. RSA 2050]|nr:hypothetical protein IWW37_004471 [Coemansia sp. RSA 2050]KAJ2731294.1 hypothetical protein IW152_004641 [Coemansia sp. BCRC 34962]